MKIQTIDYEPLSDDLNPADEEGFQSYFEGLPPSNARMYYSVVRWCCWKLQEAVENWDTDLHVDVLLDWDKANLDALTSNLVVTIGEWNSSSAKTFAFKFCPFCGEEITFEEVDRIVKRPKAEPLETQVIYRWFGPDEVPWWEKQS